MLRSPAIYSILDRPPPSRSMLFWRGCSSPPLAGRLPDAPRFVQSPARFLLVLSWSVGVSVFARKLQSAHADALPPPFQRQDRGDLPQCRQTSPDAGVRTYRLPPFGPSPHVALLARTYSRSRPLQPEKRLSQKVFFQGVNLPFLRLQRARAARCDPWAKARPSVCWSLP
jgi:hypothetical protein